MTESATFGGGCFWCIEALFGQLKGVVTVTPGYAGGNQTDPDYEQVCSGATGHAEVVQVEFEPDIISFQDLLEIFFAVHDPTTLNRQGNDEGTQYRSIILYHDDAQKITAEKVLSGFAADKWDDPIVTEIVPLTKFWPAEEYHKNYFLKNPESGYCRVIINPKLNDFRKNFSSKLKVST